MAASGDIMLTAEQSAALLGVLPDNGDSVTLDVGADGVTRAGVTFTCMSDYPCTVTVSNSAGTIVAMWASQTLGDGTASAMASGLEPPPETDPFVELNDANATTVAGIIQDPIEDSTDAPPEGSANGNVSTTVGGLGLEGVGAADDSMVTLTSDLDPNMATNHTRAVVDGTSGAVTTAATGGSTLMAAGDMNDEITENADSVAAMGWSHRMLFRDWGDTAGTGDGGYETGALVYSNIEMPTMAPFDANLGDMFANSWVEAWFDLDVDTDADGTNDLVTIETAAAGWTVPVQNIVITVEGSQAAATQLNIPAVGADARNTANEYRGTYFGAMGTFACVGTGSCVIERAMTGETSFMVADVDPNADGLQLTGQSNWEFTPDPGAMVTVPDQDWMVFGAWLTTPDVAAGQHRLGVFYTGMNEYVYGDGSQLTGSATYNGSAAGVYADGMNSGLFTARAMLMATFSGTGANTLSGRIDDFRDTAGDYLGTDTAMDPNDPDTGGENDWVVVLGSTAINATGTFDAAGSVTGSADGVRWTEGEWMAQLYGPGNGGAAPPAGMMQPQPSGVAGQFRAGIDAAGDGTGTVTTGVVGAFGAERMMPADDSN